MKGKRRERGEPGHELAQLRGMFSASEERARARDRKISELQESVAELKGEIGVRDERIAELEAEVGTMRRTLSYYQNSNTPPPSASLEHKRRKREVRLARALDI